MNNSTLNVLVVEDNDDDAVLLLRDLQRGGYETVHRRVDNADALSDALRFETWDVVIADYYLPGFGGLEALEMVQQAGLDLPFILVSGQVGEEHAHAAMRAGAHDYILKEQLARLVPAVERELREANTRRARRQAEALLLYHARHDALTGLCNRREFERQLEQAKSVRSEGDRVSVLGYLDLDQFKVVNDTSGHTAGDELLKHCAAIISQSLGEQDVVARLGGDEFALLLRECTMDEALAVSRKVLDQLHAFRFTWSARQFDISASIGLVQISGDQRSSTELMSVADVACYAAKDLGRNRVHVYESDDIDIARRHREMFLIADLTKALDENRFQLFYQRIEPTADSENLNTSIEVLLRMFDEHGKMISPGAFIPAAERYNLMPSVDLWVVKHLLEMLENCLARYQRLPFSISVNVSGSSLNSPGYCDFVRAHVDATTLPQHTLTFEVTESSAITNMQSAIRFMEEFRELGIRFSLDDFGAGLSSFSYLKYLPVDFLKIDGSFTRDILTDPLDKAMVEAFANIGRVMGVQTVAEFVENHEILESITAMQIDYAQGYGIHKPEPLTMDSLNTLVRTYQ